jgi:hypothetical protein
MGAAKMKRAATTAEIQKPALALSAGHVSVGNLSVHLWQLMPTRRAAQWFQNVQGSEQSGVYLKWPLTNLGRLRAGRQPAII